MGSVAEHAACRDGRRGSRSPGARASAAGVQDVRTPAPVHAGERLGSDPHNTLHPAAEGPPQTGEKTRGPVDVGDGTDGATGVLQHERGSVEGDTHVVGGAPVGGDEGGGPPSKVRTAAARSRRNRVPRSDRGGVIVEFAAVVPFLMLALALVWQVVLVGITSMYASHASAEAARQAAVTPDDAERIDEEARKRVRPPWDGEDMMTVEIVERGDGRFAQVTLAMPIFLPGAAGPWDVTGESAVVQEVDPRGGSDGGSPDASGEAFGGATTGDSPDPGPGDAVPGRGDAT